jgi:multicomponent K+:H+ antiporter subunit D
MTNLVTSLIADTIPHLIVAPILVPMLAAAIMLLLAEHQRPAKLVLGMVSAFLGLGISLALLFWTDAHGPTAYRPGNWPAPFGISLAVDRFSAGMLVLTWILGTASLVFATARWHRAGVHFPALLQLQLMGLSGAFVTADIFNLFVFFEIMLAASYGLLLHGSGQPRVSASVHYLAINLAASSLFLIGVSMIYGVTGTLNMAELAARLSGAPVANRHLIDAGASILAVAFLIKAAAWPLNFWLVPAYTAATPPVAAVFALLTKVGIYALVRLWTLMFAGGPLAGFGADALLGFGLVTTTMAAIGMLGSHRMVAQIGWAVVGSAGTLLAALGFGDAKVLASAWFYLFASTTASAVAFLLVDLVDRWQAGTTTVDEAPFLKPNLEDDDVNLDDEAVPIIGRPFPASTALLGMAFLACALLLAGLPPFPTFLGKLGMIAAALAVNPVPEGRTWLFIAALLVSGLITLVALTRTGIRTFWSSTLREAPVVRRAEGLPVTALLTFCLLLTVAAGPAMRFARAMADTLHDRQAYINAVLGAAAAPRPANKGQGGSESQ